MATALKTSAIWLRSRWRAWRGRNKLQIDQLDTTGQGEVNQNMVLRAMVKDMLLDRRAERRTSMARALLYAAMVMLPMLFWAGPAMRNMLVGWLWTADDVVAVVKLQGEMVDGSRASAARVVPALERAFKAPGVKAVVLEIDSPGGSPLEAERIYSALTALKKAHPKPVVAVINNIGASAAYMVAMHCDQIYAGKYSLVGSVGAILSGWDFHKALDRVDVAQRVYTSGNLKAMLNPYIPMSVDAERKARELVQDIARQFVGDLVERRGDKLAKGVDFATGEVWGGSQAKQLGLVDEVGTFEDVLRSRWPTLTVRNYGTSEPGALPFGETASEWLRNTATEALSPRVMLR